MSRVATRSADVRATRKAGQIMASIETPGGHIDYDECGDGPTIVLVPGSCSTGAAWRPVIAALGGRLRCVTTSLLGYGGTDERRTAGRHGHRARSRDRRGRDPPRNRTGPSRRAFVRGAGGAGRRAARQGAAPERHDCRGAGREPAARLWRAPALPCLPGHDRRLFCVLPRRECRGDRGDDRLLRRSRHLRRLAGQGARVRNGDDARQPARLGQRVRISRLADGPERTRPARTGACGAGTAIRPCSVPTSW